LTAYLDTSALVKLYYPEPESGWLGAWVANRREPLLYTSLHALELHNALAAKVFRRELALGQLKRIQRLIEDDARTGVLHQLAVSWPQAYAIALELSRRHTQRLGARSLDVLHIGLAKSLECDLLLTFDPRQARLARVARLRLVQVPSPPRDR
jgi:predicted nucleic acid-binding protein